MSFLFLHYASAFSDFFFIRKMDYPYNQEKNYNFHPEKNVIGLK